MSFGNEWNEEVYIVNVFVKLDLKNEDYTPTTHIIYVIGFSLFWLADSCSFFIGVEDLKTCKMLASHPAKRISFNRSISNGDLVIVYERHDSMKAVTVSEGSVLQNRFGVFRHSDWVGKPFGSKVFSSKGGFVYLLAPTPELWTLVLSHRTQILYIADISFVIMYLEIVPGCLVLESGTGSGSLTTSLARAVAPTGHVYTFDFHEQRAGSAR